MAEKLSLTDREWKEFKVGDLFELRVARGIDKSKLEVGDTPFIGRSKDNNGLQGYYRSGKITDGKCISLGMVGTFKAFWQEDDFIASQNILTIRNSNLGKETGLFVSCILNNAIDGKYSYGNSIKASTFGATEINLPVTSSGEPDYDFMEQYIKQIYDDFTARVSVYAEPVNKNKELSLSDRDWKEFKVGDLFGLTRGKRITKQFASENPGSIPVIAGGESDNGVLCYLSEDCKNIRVWKDECITVASYGTAGCVHYQGSTSFIDDKAIALELKTIEIGMYTYLWLEY